MYYHNIDFFTQASFFCYSFAAGILDGVLALFLCSSAWSHCKRLKIVFDIFFALISVFLIVITNIIFQDAALRFYEMLAFFIALILFLCIFKKRGDKLTKTLFSFVYHHFVFPLMRLCKQIINKLKNVLKKIGNVVYNFIQKSKERIKQHAKKEKTKKEKAHSAQTAS